MRLFVSSIRTSMCCKRLFVSSKPFCMSARSSPNRAFMSPRVHVGPQLAEPPVHVAEPPVHVVQPLAQVPNTACTRTASTSSRETPRAKKTAGVARSIPVRGPQPRGAASAAAR